MADLFLCQWSGEAFVPAARHFKRCDAELVIGEKYFVEPIAPRSAKSHNHYFANLSDMWGSIPENQADRFPSVEHLRKHALVMTGWRDERTFVTESKAAALRLASFVKPMNEHAVVTVRENVVRVWTAQSQSRKAMGKIDFAKSKEDVLSFVATIIGVVPETVQTETRRSA